MPRELLEGAVRAAFRAVAGSGGAVQSDETARSHPAKASLELANEPVEGRWSGRTQPLEVIREPPRGVSRRTRSRHSPRAGDRAAVREFSPKLPLNVVDAAEMKPVPASGKPRKPYTITKSRESWTDAEHNMFLEAINLCVTRLRPNRPPPRHSRKTRCCVTRALLGADTAPASSSARRYDRDWKQIEKYVGTKTVIQIRSHAQKYFLKVRARPAPPPPSNPT